MTKDATSAQLDRIAHAVNRIEAAAKAISSRPSQSDGTTNEKLLQHNETLKNETKAAIAAIDGLIAQIGGES